MIIDFKFFFEKIYNKESFAFLRFNDGELIVIKKSDFIDQISDERHGVFFDPEDEKDIELSARLYETLIYMDKSYYIGLPRNEEWRDQLKPLVKQKEKYLVDSCLFTISIIEFLDGFKKVVNSGVKINWVCNEIVKKNFPLFVDKFFFIKDNAWRVQYHEILNLLCDYAKNVKNELFMFSAGMFSNILIYNCWKLNKNNMYVDVGSVFDYFTHGNTRTYHLTFKEELEKKKEIWKKKKS